MERAGSRIDAIDALRGLALLGVLIINLDTEFRVTFFEQFSPHYAPGADQLARAVLGLLVEFKAITIFSMLFGVGLAIQAETLGRRGSVPRLLVRRLLVLFAFGLVHLLLIWNGDILTEYAMAGLVALPFILGPPGLTLAASLAALLLFLLLPSLPLPLPFPGPDWITRHVVEARHPLPNPFSLCSHARMIELTPATVSAAIRSAPAFARLGLSMRDPNTRERAADALAVAVVERLERPSPLVDPDQMPLPL